MEDPISAPDAAYNLGTVLLVEDEILIRFVMAEELMRAGFPVIQCASAEEARKVLQCSVRIDLVVLTINRTADQQEASSLADSLRLNRPAIKIVIVADEDAPAAEKGTTFLAKPLRAPDLVDCVRGLLAKPNAKP